MTIYINDLIHAGELIGKSKQDIIQDYQDALNAFKTEYSDKAGYVIEMMTRGYLLHTYMTTWVKGRGINPASSFGWRIND